jgi:hypothetical protein
MREQVARYRYEILGSFGALALFAWGMSYPIEDRFLGDATAYFKASMSIHDPLQALFQINPFYPNAFPSLLALIRWVLTLFGPITLNKFTLVVSLTLFVIHLIVVTYFLRVAFDWIREKTSLEIWPWAKLLLYLYPGLILYTTVALTDTLAADGLMLFFALGLRKKWMRAGLALGACAWLRQAYLPLAAVISVVVLVDCAWNWRQLPQSAALLLIGFALPIAAPLLNCAASFNTVCLADPRTVQTASDEGRRAGLVTGRIRWSNVVPKESDGGTKVTPGVTDEFLKRNFGDPCQMASLSCFATRPHLLPVLAFKKAVALQDNYHAQPYVADSTPAWYRRLGRLFGSIAFVGLFACLPIAWALRKGYGWLPPSIALVPWILVGTHSFFGIESRYGLGSVAVCLVAAMATARFLVLAKPPHKIVGAAAIVILVALFYWQTGDWDQADRVLRTAEGW